MDFEVGTYLGRCFYNKQFLTLRHQNMGTYGMETYIKF